MLKGFAAGFMEARKLRFMQQEAKLQKQEADAKTRYYDSLFAKAQLEQQKFGEELLERDRLRFGRRQAGAASALLHESPALGGGGGAPQGAGGIQMFSEGLPQGPNTVLPGGVTYSPADRAMLSSPTPSTGIQLDPESRAQLQRVLQRQRAGDPEYGKGLKEVSPGNALFDPQTRQAVFTTPPQPASDVGKLLQDREAYAAQGRTPEARAAREALFDAQQGASDQLADAVRAYPQLFSNIPERQRMALVPKLMQRGFDFQGLEGPYADLSQGVKDRVQARGVTKPTAQDIRQALSEEEQERVRVSAAQGTARPLSVDDAARMGVPAGTTAGELRGQGAVPPLSGDAAKVYQMGSRMSAAHATLQQLEASGVIGTPTLNTITEAVDSLAGGVGAAVGTVTGRGFAGGAAGGALGLGVGQLAKGFAGKLRTPEERQYLTAQLAFIAAILRKESGAAITREEYLQYGRIYFPQPADDAETVAYKAQLRQQAVDTLQAQFPNRPFAPGPPSARRSQEASGTEAGASGAPQRPRPAGQVPPGGSGREPLKAGINPTVAVLIRQRTPEQIMRMQDGQLRGITAPEDIPGLSAAQRQALALKLAGMRSRQQRATQAGVPR